MDRTSEVPKDKSRHTCGSSSKYKYCQAFAFSSDCVLDIIIPLIKISTTSNTLQSTLVVFDNMLSLLSSMILVFASAHTAMAAPKVASGTLAAREWHEVVPGPGLPSLASLNLTSAELYEMTPARRCYLH